MDEIYIKNRKNLISVAKHMGLLSGCSQEFLDKYCKNGYEGQNVIYEAFTRAAMECIFLDINPYLKLRQMPLDSAYDAETMSGDTTVKIEGKTRMIASTTYPTLDITYNKGEMLQDEQGLLVVLCLNDLKWAVWDLSEYTPEEGTWTHRKYTADNRDNWVVTERKLQFDMKRAKWRGDLGHWMYGEG